MCGGAENVSEGYYLSYCKPVKPPRLLTILVQVWPVWVYLHGPAP